MAQLAMLFTELPGVEYIPEFITLKEERAVIEFLRAQEHWVPFGTRKLCQRSV